MSIQNVGDRSRSNVQPEHANIPNEIITLDDDDDDNDRFNLDFESDSEPPPKQTSANDLQTSAESPDKESPINADDNTDAMQNQAPSKRVDGVTSDTNNNSQPSDKQSVNEQRKQQQHDMVRPNLRPSGVRRKMKRLLPIREPRIEYVSSSDDENADGDFSKRIKLNRTETEKNQANMRYQSRPKGRTEMENTNQNHRTEKENRNLNQSGSSTSNLLPCQTPKSNSRSSSVRNQHQPQPQNDEISDTDSSSSSSSYSSLERLLFPE